MKGPILHPQDCSDDSVSASESAHVNINRFTIPEIGQQRTVIIVLFVLLAASLTINCLNYARMGRDDEKLLLAEQRATEAEKGAHTQDWADADTLSKENAEIRGQVIAIELILQSHWGIEIPKPNPVPPRLRQEKH